MWFGGQAKITQLKPSQAKYRNEMYCKCYWKAINQQTYNNNDRNLEVCWTITHTQSESGTSAIALRNCVIIFGGGCFSGFISASNFGILGSLHRIPTAPIFNMVRFRVRFDFRQLLCVDRFFYNYCRLIGQRKWSPIPFPDIIERHCGLPNIYKLNVWLLENTV